MNGSDKAAGFDADRLSRRLERERRLKEIELSFQNIAEESKQKQNDIFNNVFTEEGQEQMMVNHENGVGGVGLEEGVHNNMYSENLEPSPPSSSQKTSRNKILPRIAEMVTPKKSKRKKQNSQTFQVSPNGVASFPDIGPSPSASPSSPPRLPQKKNDPKSPSSWRKDGPGVVGRMSSARVQDQIIHSFFAARRHYRKIIIAVLLVALLVTLSVTLSDIKSSTNTTHVEDWNKLREVQAVLISQNVDRRQFINRRGAYFEALAWLANDEVRSQAATGTSTMSSSSDRVLLERFVLAVFYHSTTDDDTYWKNDWALDEGDYHGNTSVCQWHGVRCADIKTHVDDNEGYKVEKLVESIDLTNNSLSGTITDEISKLKNLKSLILSNNRLQGTIPSSIGKLHQLEILEVGENQLTGEMPDSVCDLKTWKLIRLASDCGGFDGDIVCTCCTDCLP